MNSRLAVVVEDAEEHGGVAADFGVAAEEAVDVIDDTGGVGAESHGGKRALQHGGEQGGAKSFARDVGDEEGGAAFADGKDVEVVAPDGQAGQIVAIDGEMGKFAEVAREERLLNVARDVDLLFEALAFALAFDETGVVQNAGGVGGEGVENLAVELGEGGGAARVQVEDTEKIAALHTDHGFLGVGAGHGVERNDYYGAKALGDDALRGLQVHIGLREIFGDDRRLLLEGKLNGGLAGREAFRWKAQAAATACQLHFERAGDVRFEEQAAIGIGDGNGVIQHVTEHYIERKLRVKERGRLEKALELDEAAAGGFGAGDVLDASEQIWQGRFIGTGIRAEDDFVGIVEAEADGIAILEFAAFDFFAVDEKAAALAAILDVETIGFDDDGGAVAGDAPVG